MERINIDYKGIDYPAIQIPLSKVSDIESDEIVTIADHELWAAIEDDYEKSDADAVYVNDDIYLYCESGFVAGNPTESEVIEYINRIL